MSRPRILVINPNSNPAVTQGLEEALKPLDFAGGPEVICQSLAEGPFGLLSDGAEIHYHTTFTRAPLAVPITFVPGRPLDAATAGP